jgi:hypothetical protein
MLLIQNSPQTKMIGVVGTSGLIALDSRASMASMQKRKGPAMSDIQQRDWTKPSAMAIPNGGVFEGNRVVCV